MDFLKKNFRAFAALVTSVVVTLSIVVTPTPTHSFIPLGGSTVTIQNADYTWSGTVTGAAKSASAGFIVPVVFSNNSTITSASYQGGYIFPTSSTRPVDIYFQRVLGDTGSLSLNLATFNSINAAAGTNYTSVSTTLTWSDGERGWKKITVPILSIPTGFGLIGVGMSGAGAFQPQCWIWLVGTGRVPGAHFFQSSNGTNITPGATTGAGTLVSPWTSMQNAASQVGASGGVLYWEQNSTGGHEEWSGTAGTSSGVTIGAIQASTSSPLIIINDPANTNQAFWDQGSTAGGANILYSNANCLNFSGNAANIWVVGIHFHRCNINFNNASVTSNGMVFWQNEIDNYAISGSNAAGIRFDFTTNAIIQDNYVHEIYSTESSATSNPFTAVASGFEEGMQAFQAITPLIAHNYSRLVQFGYMEKESAALGGNGWYITHNLGDYYARVVAGSGAMIHLPVQPPSAGVNWQNTIICFNAEDNTGGAVAVTQLVGNEQNSFTGSNLDMFNNVQIGAQGLIGAFYGVSGVRNWNNISQAASQTEILLGPDQGGTNLSALQYSDYNIYYKTTPTFSTHYGVGTVTYTGLAAWQAISGDPYVTNPPDAHSTTTANTPSYLNQSGHNYRWSNTLGQLGRPIGVGNEFTGIVNNQYNSSLPVVN